MIFVFLLVYPNQLFGFGRVTASGWLLLSVTMETIGCSPSEIKFADLETAATKMDYSGIVIDDGDVAPLSPSA